MYSHNEAETTIRIKMANQINEYKPDTPLSGPRSAAVGSSPASSFLMHAACRGTIKPSNIAMPTANNASDAFTQPSPM